MNEKTIRMTNYFIDKTAQADVRLTLSYTQQRGGGSVEHCYGSPITDGRMS